MDLIEEGRFDEAERKCLELRSSFHEAIDWIERTAELYEARGDVDKAIEHSRLCLADIDRDPDGFDAESRAWYQKQIDRLPGTGP